VGGVGALLAVPREEKADVAFVSCADGGRLYRTPSSWRQARFGSPIQANFVALLHDGRGVLLHPEHHAYTVGFGARENRYGMGCTQFFRPSRTALFAMPLCHDALSFELVALSDANGDGGVNWVDAGIAYRDRCIKPNRHLDAALRDGPSGKLRWQPEPELRRTLQRLRGEIKDVPITIWMLAPTGPGADFLPSEKLRKTWRELKRDMARIGVRLSPHDNLDDVAPEIAAADPAHVRWDDKLRLMPAYRDCFRRALDDEAYVSGAVEARLSAWSAKRGDTWHIDVFANAPFEDYCPARPSTWRPISGTGIGGLPTFTTVGGFTSRANSLTRGITRCATTAGGRWRGTTARRTSSGSRCCPCCFRGAPITARSIRRPRRG
jgi:hypothetical protein